jgi:hypothetical protein
MGEHHRHAHRTHLPARRKLIQPTETAISEVLPMRAQGCAPKSRFLAGIFG